MSNPVALLLKLAASLECLAPSDTDVRTEVQPLLDEARHLATEASVSELANLERDGDAILLRAASGDILAIVRFPNGWPTRLQAQWRIPVTVERAG